MDNQDLMRLRIAELEQEVSGLRDAYSVRMYEVRARTVPIQGFLDTLLHDENEEWYTREDRHEFLTILQENANQIRQLTEGPIEVNGEELGPNALDMKWQKEVDVCKIIRNTFEIQCTVGTNHNLVFDFPVEPILIEGDPEQLDNLLRPIIRNAIKYSPDGGEIRVTARSEPPNVEFPVGSVLVQVKDSGVGLAEEDLPKVGQMFITYRHGYRPSITSHAPTGLFLTRKLVEVWGGQLWIESGGRRKGSIFNLRLPLKP